MPPWCLLKMVTGVTAVKIPDFPLVLEKSKECASSLRLEYKELWITPLRTGYRVELLPPLNDKYIASFSECLSRTLGGRVSFRVSSGVVAVYIEW